MPFMSCHPADLEQARQKLRALPVSHWPLV
jgi:hypothetical protein